MRKELVLISAGDGEPLNISIRIQTKLSYKKFFIFFSCLMNQVNQKQQKKYTERSIITTTSHLPFCSFDT